MASDSEPIRTPGFLVRRMQQVSISVFHEYLRSLGITPVQLTILRILEREDGLDQLSIASRAMLDTSTVKDVLARLAARNIVTRRRSEQDARMRLTYLTDHGRDVIEQAAPLALQASQELLAPLTKKERAQLLEMMDRVVSAREADDDRRAPWRRLKTP